MAALIVPTNHRNVLEYKSLAYASQPSLACCGDSGVLISVDPAMIVLLVKALHKTSVSIPIRLANLAKSPPLDVCLSGIVALSCASPTKLIVPNWRTTHRALIGIKRVSSRMPITSSSSTVCSNHCVSVILSISSASFLVEAPTEDLLRLTFILLLRLPRYGKDAGDFPINTSASIFRFIWFDAASN